MISRLFSRWPLLALSLVAFGTSIFFPFIALDDAKHIWQNPYVMNLSLENLRFFWKAPYYGLFVPVVYNTWSLLAGISRILGLHHELTDIGARLFHGAVVFSHLLNVYLAWWLMCFWLKRLDPQGPKASEGLLVFVGVLPLAVHPLQVEAVAWASGLKDTLSANFILLSLLAFCFTWPRPSRKVIKDLNNDTFIWLRRFPRFYFLFFAALALATKPVAVVLPFVASALVLVLERGFLKKALKILAPALIMALWTMWLTKGSQPDARLDFELAFWQKPLVAIASLGFYLGKIIFPFALAPDYGLTPPVLLNSQLFPYYAGFSVLFLCGIVFCALYFKQSLSARTFFLGGLFVLLGLGPVLGIVSFEFQNLSSVADRYFYLFPALGIGIVMVSLARAFILPHKVWVKGFAAGLALTWAILSFIQTLYWSSNESLFTHTSLVNPQSYLAYNNLGLQALRQRDFALAESNFHQALKAKPDYLAAVANLGAVYFKKQDYAGTIRYYEKALANLPAAQAGSPATYADMYFNLGAAYLNTNDLAKGLKSLQKATEINPDHFMARYNLGRAYLVANQPVKARQEFLQALRLQPGNPKVRSELKKLHQ